MVDERLQRAAIALKKGTWDVLSNPKQHIIPWPLNDESTKTRAVTYLLARVFSVHGFVVALLYDIGRHSLEYYREDED